MTKKIKVGLDFDGVVAYNPCRIIRPAIVFVKRNIFGVKGLTFWRPKYKWQQLLWIIIHESSVFPSRGTDLLEKMVKEGKIEAHLVTARYSFLDDHLFNWLKRYKLTHLFKTITFNNRDEQPHIFKEKMIKKYKLDIFIEDNWDIVNYLDRKKITKVYWIYNILDKKISYKNKFPYMRKALNNILNLHRTQKIVE